MVRVTLIWGVGKRWLELQQYVWRRDSWHWVTVGRSIFIEDPGAEQPTEELLSLLHARLGDWLDDSFAEGVVPVLPV